MNLRPGDVVADLGTGPGDLDGEDIVVNRKVTSRHFYIHQDHIVAYVVATDPEQQGGE